MPARQRAAGPSQPRTPTGVGRPRPRLPGGVPPLLRRRAAEAVRAVGRPQRDGDRQHRQNRECRDAVGQGDRDRQRDYQEAQGDGKAGRGRNTRSNTEIADEEQTAAEARVDQGDRRDRGIVHVDVRDHAGTGKSKRDGRQPLDELTKLDGVPGHGRSASRRRPTSLPSTHGPARRSPRMAIIMRPVEHADRAAADATRRAAAASAPQRCRRSVAGVMHQMLRDRLLLDAA